MWNRDAETARAIRTGDIDWKGWRMPRTRQRQPDLTADEALRIIQEAAAAADNGQPDVEIENIVAVAARAGITWPLGQKQGDSE